MVDYVKNVTKSVTTFVIYCYSDLKKGGAKMDKKRLLQKISDLLATFDLVTLVAIYRTLKRIQKGGIYGKKDTD